MQGRDAEVTDQPATYHGFDRLLLTVSESGLEDVHTDHHFELRSTGRGAEVWRSSVLHAPGGSCASGERLVGYLTARQVIDLLVEIERSGVYEALPAAGLVQGAAMTGGTPLISMELRSDSTTREVLDRVPAEQLASTGVVQAVRDAVALAQERSLSFAG